MVSQNAIEYVTQDLFKGKTLQAACRRFIKKFGGRDAVFLGVVDYTAEQLATAVLQDKVRNVKDTRALPAIANRFNLKLSDLEKAHEEATK